MNRGVRISAIGLSALWFGLGVQALASPGWGVPPAPDAANRSATSPSTRYALAGIGSVGGNPFVVLLDRVRGVPIVLDSQASPEDRIALELVGRGYIRVRIGGQGHEFAFTRGSGSLEPEMEAAAASMISIHLKRQGERSRALSNHDTYRK